MPRRYSVRRLPQGEHDFEWDPAKSDVNFEKHGLDLAAARQIFQGRVLVRQDTRKRGEVVHQALGEFAGHVIFAVYTMRAGRCRLISARFATAEEAALYHE
ncbi:MAG: BrnT family toxin [Proteobacteria bacterium]|nr:BrnT family toxin [Pseudomonadota bacterium]MBI3498538.1 BrnT family toxin [Pseudomonadota bacterium]